MGVRGVVRRALVEASRVMFPRVFSINPPPEDEPPLSEQFVEELTLWWLSRYGKRAWQDNVKLFLREYEVRRRG